jgi:hypothetical protein
VRAVEAVLALAFLPAALLAESGIAVIARAPLAAELFGMRDPPGAVVGELARAIAGVPRIAPAMLLVAEGQGTPRGTPGCAAGKKIRGGARNPRAGAALGRRNQTHRSVAWRGNGEQSPGARPQAAAGRTIQAQFCRMDRGYLTRVTPVKKNSAWIY